MRREKMLKGVLSFALLVFVMGIMIWLNPANARAGSLYDVYWNVDKDEAGKYIIQLSHDTGMKEGITEGWDCYTREEQKKDIENDQYWYENQPVKIFRMFKS